MNINELTERVEKYDQDLAKDIAEYFRGRQYGLVYEASKPEFVRLWNKPIVKGDLVNVLPPRGVKENTKDDSPSNVAYCFLDKNAGAAKLKNTKTLEELVSPFEDLVAISRFDNPIYCGLIELDRVEHGGDNPYHVVINGENYHALQTLAYAFTGKVDCIYIDPPYNTGAKDWKYNNNYVGTEDIYRHSKWLTFMEDRLRIAKKLLNPKESVLIVTIDEKEYLRLGLLLEQMFPEACIDMISSVINPAGVSRNGQFSRTNEYIYVVYFGGCRPTPLPLGEEWIGNIKNLARKKGLRWNTLLRSGSHVLKADSPNQFYPVFVKADGSHIVSIGEPYFGNNRNEVQAPEGCVAIWPIRANGEEGNWQVSRTSLKTLIEKGYVRLGRFNDRGTIAIDYLKKGEIKKIESGVFKILGYNKNGTVIVDDSDYVPTFIPGCQWNISSHDATQQGTKLLKSILPDDRFSYPKSLYAVVDILKFFVANKPNALILDFFAGSGTTLHAVNILNAEDCGRRRCICVTNNEVSEEEQKAFVAKKLRPTDKEWKQRGIANYVTWPRTVCSIEGHDVYGCPLKGAYIGSGEAMEKGFASNAVFFELTYEEPTIVSADCSFERIAPILWLRSGCVGRILQREEGYAIGESYAILFDYTQVRRFTDIVHNQPEIKHIFIVTDTKTRYRNMCMEFPDRDVIQLYESYLRSFEINTED